MKKKRGDKLINELSNYHAKRDVHVFAEEMREGGCHAN